MIWDCLLVSVVMVFAVVGWHRGMVRSWTVPISMAVATFICQHIYIDVSTMLAATLHLESIITVSTAYVFTWLFLVECCDFILSLTVRTVDSTLPIHSHIGGAVVGFAKGLCIFILAAMAACTQNKVPEPPKACAANAWIIDAAANSHMLPNIQLAALSLDRPIGKFVLSESEPRFQPNFDLGNDPLGPLIKRPGAEFADDMKNLLEHTGLCKGSQEGKSSDQAEGDSANPPTN